MKPTCGGGVLRGHERLRAYLPIRFGLHPIRRPRSLRDVLRRARRRARPAAQRPLHDRGQRATAARGRARAGTVGGGRCVADRARRPARRARRPPRPAGAARVPVHPVSPGGRARRPARLDRRRAHSLPRGAHRGAARVGALSSRGRRHPLRRRPDLTPNGLRVISDMLCLLRRRRRPMSGIRVRAVGLSVSAKRSEPFDRYANTHGSLTRSRSHHRHHHACRTNSSLMAQTAHRAPLRPARHQAIRPHVPRPLVPQLPG